MQNFRALGAPPPDPRASGGWGFAPRPPPSVSWGLRPQPPWAFGGWRLRPQTQKLALPLRISGYAHGSICGEDLFFALHLICSSEKNRGRGFSPQC